MFGWLSRVRRDRSPESGREPPASALSSGWSSLPPLRSNAGAALPRTGAVDFPRSLTTRTVVRPVLSPVTDASVRRERTLPAGLTSVVARRVQSSAPDVVPKFAGAPDLPVEPAAHPRGPALS